MITQNMSALFEVVRLLTVGREHAANHRAKVNITKFAWKEDGEVSMLAIACSNDNILLRYSIAGKAPVVKKLPWLPEKEIASMCFDPTVAWLLVMTKIPELYVVPAFSLMEPKAQVNQLWKTNDITLLRLQKPKGEVTVVSWWHTLDDHQIAVVGTKAGELFFVDLLKKCVVFSTKVDRAIMEIDLIHDDQQMTASLLITAAGGNQWKLLLESRTQPLQWSHDREVSDLGYDNIDGRSLPVKNIMLQSEETREMFLPIKCEQFEQSVRLAPQYAKGRHFVTAHCDKTSTFQVYDSSIEHCPLFVYKLPVDFHNVVLTDRLIFGTSHVNKKKLVLISNQKAETSLEDHQDFNKEAIVQQFDMPSGESLLGMEKKMFPFYWHEKREEELQKRIRGGSVLEQPRMMADDTNLLPTAPTIPVGSHTVLDGCIVVTDRAVYECRPRISPERLFLDLAIQHTDASCAESLGICIGLDLTALFELAADYLLKTGEFSRAARLYHLSKCSHVKRVANLAQHGHIQEVTSLLRQVLNSPQVELNTCERKQLADMALHSCIYQMVHDKGISSNMLDSFRDFLFGSFFFDERTALHLLAEYSLISLLLEFAKARGLVVEALELLVSQSQFNIPHHLLTDLVTRGFSAHLIQASQGALLQCMPPDDLVGLLLTKPQLAIQNVSLLEYQLSLLDENLLLALADVFDPTKPIMRGYITRQQDSRRRTTSISSLTSFTSEIVDFSLDMSGTFLARLLEFFLMVVLQLNKLRDTDVQELELSDLLTDLDTHFTQPKEKKENLLENKRKLAIQPSAVGCGSCHTALVRNGDLYIWGKASCGRLGHGDLVDSNSISPPSRVETLHMLQIRVLSVACGGEHTIVLTHQGVYGWGSSQLGQVGVGRRHVYSRPMLIEALSTECCVSVDCGQYHSMALTQDSEVYSWGWGVHGQLGHGNPEDVLVPTKIEDLSDKSVVRIALGYCHSMALTEKGDIYVFGCAYFGQLGLGDNVKQSSPVKLDAFGEPITLIGTKYFTSIGVTANNKVYSWGCHPHSLRYSTQLIRRARQLGKHLNDPVESFLNPVLVDTVYVNGKISQVACGSVHTILLTTDGDVFVWGRNMDGQLGIGSRQDERIPRMLTKINDHLIVCVKSGGEYNVALDTVNQMWVWGKNDAGQLGLQISGSSGNIRPHRVMSHRRSHSGSAIDPIVPVILKGLPAQDPSSPSPWQQSLMASSDSGDSELWISEDINEDRHLMMMPYLEKVGKVKYNKKVVSAVVKYLSHLFSTASVLRKCIDIGDWLTAADICILDENYGQALSYHLDALNERTSVMSPDKLRHFSIQLVQHHIKLCINKTASRTEREGELKFIVLEVMKHWEKNRLSISELEMVFVNHLSSLAYSLSFALFRSQNCQSTKEEANDATILGPSAAFIQQFSTKFCLHVLHAVLAAAAMDPEKGFKDWKKVVKLPELIDSTESVRIELQSSDKLIPYDRLWQDVIQNLRKHSDLRDYISITRNEMDHLEVQVEDQMDVDSGKSGLAVLFTCGHHFTKRTFTDEVLKSFEKELMEGPRKLPYSASLLCQYYTRQGLLPLACPKCVLNALATIS